MVPFQAYRFDSSFSSPQDFPAPPPNPSPMTTPNEANFWQLPLGQLLAQLETTPQGLTSAEAARRLRRYGPNALAKEARFAFVWDLLRLLLNPLVLILLAASIISFATGERVNAFIIIIIVLVSVFVDFYQSFQARHAVEQLRSQVASKANALRDGKEQEIDVAAVVPGDIVILNAGDLVPADARLLDEKDLQVRESALTGESLPVEKEAGDLKEDDVPLAQATNSVFLGTTVQTGIGTAVVVHTGAATAFGGIAAHLAQRPPETEFDRGIRNFGILITRVIILLVIFVFAVNVWYPPLVAGVAALLHRPRRGAHPGVAPRGDLRHPRAGRPRDGPQESHCEATRLHRELRQHRDPLLR